MMATPARQTPALMVFARILPSFAMTTSLAQLIIAMLQPDALTLQSFVAITIPAQLMLALTVNVSTMRLYAMTMTAAQQMLALTDNAYSRLSTATTIMIAQQMRVLVEIVYLHPFQTAQIPARMWIVMIMTDALLMRVKTAVAPIRQ